MNEKRVEKTESDIYFYLYLVQNFLTMKIGIYDFGLAGLIIIFCLFLSCSACAFWWFVVGELLPNIILTGFFDVVNIFVAFGSARISVNLNLSNIAFAGVYVALVLLIIVVDTLLEELFNRLRNSAKLPELSVVNFYEGNNYVQAIGLAGMAHKWKKKIPRVK